jgi:hypothetical protein
MRPSRSIALPTRRSALAAGLLCAALLAVIGAAPARAEIRPFSVHDTNRDGYLDREEYRVLLEMRRGRRHRHRGIPRQPAPAFDEVDHNRDGLLNEAELTEALRHRLYRYGHHGRRWHYPDTTH